MERCSWDGCQTPITYGGQGARRKYCPEHSKASKKRSDKRRPDSGHTRKLYPRCCLDAHAAGVRTYGAKTIRYQGWDSKLYQPYTVVARVGAAYVKSANVRVCPQHTQWRAFYGRSRRQFLAHSSELRDEKNNPQLAEVKQSEAFRLTMNNPDDYVPTQRAEVTEAGVKSGYDAKLEAMARRWLASAPNGRERDDVIITEPAPVYDLDGWRERCAEGRRWHKTDAFRYPPEMNRGAGWCAKLIPLSRGVYPLSHFPGC